MSQTMKKTKLCSGCSTVKKIEEFNYKNKAKGTRQTRCRICTRKQVKRHYNNHRPYYLKKAQRRNEEVKARQRDKVLAYLATHPCVDCGENDIVCLEFDHIHGPKVNSISDMLGNYGWAAIEAEIAKCEVRCANCHRRKTAKHFGYWTLKL